MFIYRACTECKEDIKNLPAEPVPLWICNAPTDLMKELHYGEGYIYAHNTKEKIAKMQCLPDSLKGRRYYQPDGEGQENQVREKLIKILQWKNEDSTDLQE